MNLGSRVVQKMRASKFVSLPKEFLDFNGIEAGDEVEFILRSDESLTVRKVNSAPAHGVWNLGRRVVQNVRFSKCVILPKEWLDNKGVEAGDEVEFILRKDGSLMVQKASAPVAPEEEISDEERAELHKIRKEAKGGKKFRLDAVLDAAGAVKEEG